MKDFYFKDAANLDQYLENNLAATAPNELAVFEFDSLIPALKIEESLPQVLTRNSSLYIKINTSEPNCIKKIEFFIKLGVKNICLKVPLMARTDIELPLTTSRFHHPRDRSHTIGEFESIRGYFQQRAHFTCEIVLDEKYLNVLYPTLDFFNTLQLPWVFLNPNGLSFKNNVKSVSNVFLQLRMNKKINLNIYFSPSHPHFEHWNNRTENLLSGPKFVDIDVANTCTHNCVFCGLYSDESLERYKKSNGGKFESALLKKMAAKIDRDDCLNFINSLSDATQFVQFGGLGDPFTHKNIVEFISACRSRNFSVSCLTNFSYMNEEILNELHTMSSTDPEALTFIVNLSAANAATYMLNRPNQKQTTFEKVISDLKYSQRLRERDGHGITFSLMSVTNKLNYRDMPELVALAKDVGAEKIWIKPIEVHGDETLQYLIPESEQFEYARMAQLVLIFAKQLNVNVFMPEVLETLAKTFQKELLDYQKHTPIEKQFEILAEKSELIRRYYQNAAKSEFKHNLKVHQVPYFPIPLTTLNDVTPIENVQLSETASTEENKLDLGVANADLPAQFYDKLSCKIGYQYFRVEVLGNALPCCISNIQLDNIKGRHLKDIWLSDQLDVFRDKMNRINIEKFHRTDSEWMFCQQCPHVGINENFHMTRGINIKPIVR